MGNTVPTPSTATQEISQFLLELPGTISKVLPRPSARCPAPPPTTAWRAQNVLRSGKFLKTVHCRHDDGEVVVKVGWGTLASGAHRGSHSAHCFAPRRRQIYVKRDSTDLGPHQRRLVDIAQRLSLAAQPNVRARPRLITPCGGTDPRPRTAAHAVPAVL